VELSIHIDRVACIGSGQCVHWAPGVFEQDDRAIAVVVDPRGEPEHKVLQAVLGCPMQAITLHLDGTPIRPDDLKDWMLGAHVDGPIVPVVEDLAVAHDDLRTLLATGTADAVHEQAVLVLRGEAHLYDELEATGLVDAGLVAAFRAAHPALERAVADAAPDLGTVLDDHIRLEETVLFPATLAALARRARSRTNAATPAS
jgi:ferredoxin